MCSGQIAHPKCLVLWHLSVQQLLVPTENPLLAHFMDNGIKLSHDLIYTGRYTVTKLQMGVGKYASVRMHLLISHQERDSLEKIGENWNF